MLSDFFAKHIMFMFLSERLHFIRTCSTATMEGDLSTLCYRKCHCYLLLIISQSAEQREKSLIVQRANSTMI